MAAKKRKSYHNKKQGRTVKDRILIVCEGKVTEPTYFNWLRQQVHLQNITIKIKPGKKPDPASIFQTAQEIQDKEEVTGEGYDKIYCVFDEDGRSNNKGQKYGFEKTCRDIENKKCFKKILSTPCIEYWFLLHFIYYCSESTAAVCKKKLKSEGYLGKYNGSISDKNFKKLWNNLEIAKNNAKKAEEEARKTDKRNPSTEVHLLIEALEKMAD